MSYVTWTRYTPGHVGSYPIRSGTPTVEYDQTDLFQAVLNNPANTSGWLSVPRQVTYSWRTSHKFEPELSTSERIVDSVSNAATSFRAVRAAYSSQHDTGHNFDTHKHYWTDIGSANASGPWGWFIGPCYPAAASGVTKVLTNVSDLGQADSALISRGQEGIRDTLPTKSPASLAQALIELKREGIPSLLGSTLLRRDSLRNPARAGSEEFLNLEFGIKPLIRDLQEASLAVLQAQEILDSYKEGAGKKQHRQRTFPTTVETSHTHTLGSVSNRPWYTVSYRFPIHGRPVTTVTSTRISEKFTGAFTYHLGDSFYSDSLSGYSEQASYLLGLKLTPELLWEVTPWSWLSDWVFNIGINISNAQALMSDGLVLRYGYIMRHTHKSMAWSMDAISNENGVLLPSATLNFERKQRIRATPYGFGLNASSFSGRQWSILAALGLTRGNRSLRLSD